MKITGDRAEFLILLPWNVAHLLNIQLLTRWIVNVILVQININGSTFRSVQLRLVVEKERPDHLLTLNRFQQVSATNCQLIIFSVKFCSFKQQKSIVVALSAVFLIPLFHFIPTAWLSLVPQQSDLGSIVPSSSPLTDSAQLNLHGRSVALVSSTWVANITSNHHTSRGCRRLTSPPSNPTELVLCQTIHPPAS